MILSILFVFGVSVLYLIWKKSTSTSIILPGPRGLPVFGNIFSLDTKNGIHLKLMEWSKIYGHIFKIKLLQEEVVIVSEHAAAYEALVSKSRDFAGRPSVFRLTTSFPNDIGIVDFGDKFIKHKKIGTRGLKVYAEGVDRVAELAKLEIEKTMDELKETKGQPVGPWDIVKRFTFRIILRMVMGEHVLSDNQDLDRSMPWLRLFNEHIMEDSPDGLLLDMFPWTRFFGSKKYKMIVKMVEERRNNFEEFITRLEQAKITDHPNSDNTSKTLLEELVDAYNDGEISRDAVYNITHDAFAAGIYTTSTTTCSLLIVLLNYPDVQKKIHAEIDRVLGRERMPELSDRSSLPYIEATLLELLRFTSTAPLGVPHKTTCDTTLQGHFLPKDTQVWINLYAIHHDEHYYPNPNTFDPTRFLDKDGQVVALDNRPSYFPFGAGRRVCVGEVLAKTRLFLFVTRMLQLFTILPSDIIPPADMNTSFYPSLTFIPKPFEIKVFPR